MPGVKRPLNDVVALTDAVHPSRRRRLGYSEADAQLAKIYEELADEVPNVRLKAAGKLVKLILEDPHEQAAKLDEVLTRLVKGLCSNRKAARPGFFMALVEILSVAFDLAYNGDAKNFRLAPLTDRIIQLTQPEGKPNGQEMREYSHGRWSALQAVLQSKIASSPKLSDEEWRTFLDAVCDLASQKDWLRSECGSMLYKFMTSPTGGGLSDQRVKTLVDSLEAANLLKTPEGVALWLSISAQWPDALPRKVWHKKDPLSSKEKMQLKKVLQGSQIADNGDNATSQRSKSGSRQSQPNLAWKVILEHLSQREKPADFTNFWQESVENCLFAASSSPERKALGFQVVKLAVESVPPLQLQQALSAKIVHNLKAQRADPSRYLYDAAKVVLDSFATRAKKNPETTTCFLRALLEGAAVDQQTKTKTIEMLVRAADSAALADIANTLREHCFNPIAAPDGQEGFRRILADMLLATLRSQRDKLMEYHTPGAGKSPLSTWAVRILRCLVDIGYRELDDTTKLSISDSSRSVFRARLMSCLGALLDHEPADAAEATRYVIKALGSVRESLHKPLSKEAQDVIERAVRLRKDLEQPSAKVSSTQTSDLAFKLLFDFSIMQVYNEDVDSIAALEDLTTSFESRQQGGDSSSTLIELLLSFVSKPSALFRKLAEQVFSAFASELNLESLQSLLDILQQKESLSGQQELFDQHGDDEDAEGADDNGEEDAGIDVGDASDVELLNGEEAEDMDDGTDDDASSSEAASGADDDDANNEEAIFDRKLQNALGTAGMDKEDSDEDGSDMDDEQMMALEPHLANIFKERKKNTSKKQDNKDAKENIVNFKNRVLDLLSIYVKSQYANPLALDLILPLTALVRSTTSKPTSEKAFAALKHYFDACSKHKGWPNLGNAEACFVLLAAVHDEMKLGGSKLHANACSRSSLFLCRVLVASDPDNYTRIAEMYARLQSQWWLDPKSKVQGSVFTEWTSWSLTTRKLK